MKEETMKKSTGVSKRGEYAEPSVVDLDEMAIYPCECHSGGRPDASETCYRGYSE